MWEELEFFVWTVRGSDSQLSLRYSYIIRHGWGQRSCVGSEVTLPPELNLCMAV